VVDVGHYWRKWTGVPHGVMVPFVVTPPRSLGDAMNVSEG
jgi:hypothetical protein